MLVTINDDFDLQKICDSGQCFRCRPIGESTYRFITQHEVLYISQVTSTEYETSCGPDVWKQTWIPYFDLHRSYRSVRLQVHDDPFMLRAAAAGKGIRILRQDPWETLISFILSQQKRIPAIRNMVEHLACTYGEPIQSENEIVFCFPSPAALASADLKDCRMGYREKYVKSTSILINKQPDLFERWADLDDEALLLSLKELPGVGDKVANCVMLFAYGRTACAPIDTWIRKITDKEYSGKNPFPEYGDVAGILQQYAFYYAQQHKEEFQ